MPSRRRHTRVCVLCAVWLTRHPSRICRDCRPLVETGWPSRSAPSVEAFDDNNERAC